MILIGSLMLLITACNEKTAQKLSANQQTALHYLLHQSLISDTFSRMLFEEAIDFRAMDPKKNLLYFVFSKKLNKMDMVNLIAIDTTQVEYAPCENGPCNFGGLRGNVDKIYALRISTFNLKVDSNMFFPMKLESFKDSLAFEDVRYLQDSSLYYISNPFFDINGQAAANLGHLVMKKDKQSAIYKLAHRLKGKTKKEEKIIQQIQNFVANEIKYSYLDMWYRQEVLQRPHDVLISGFGDCSAKTVLMASLLEQLDIPYQILYYKNHVNIGVEGKFSNKNKYSCTIRNKKYYLAECTCKDFEIGVSILEKDVLPELSYYQYPRKDDKIYRYENDKVVKQYSEAEMLTRFGR